MSLSAGLSVIDPYYKLIERNPSDNVNAVSTGPRLADERNHDKPCVDINPCNEHVGVLLAVQNEMDLGDSTPMPAQQRGQRFMRSDGRRLSQMNPAVMKIQRRAGSSCFLQKQQPKRRVVVWAELHGDPSATICGHLRNLRVAVWISPARLA